MPNSRIIVYLLSFQSNNDKFFFWMQDPNLSNNENYCKSVNDVINFSPIDEEDDQNIEEEEEKVMPQPKISRNPRNFLCFQHQNKRSG